MQKVINELINQYIQGIDTYRYKDSTWLIFSNETRWVVELTDEGTLWFNYKFFDALLGYVSVSARDGSEYITQWAKDYFFKPNKEIISNYSGAIHRENLAMNIVHGKGVKTTKSDNDDRKRVFYNPAYKNGYVGVYDVMSEGIKKAIQDDALRLWDCKCVFEKGIKETKEHHFEEWEYIGHIVQDGIKNTYPDMNPNDYDWSDEFKADKIILNGEKI